MESSRVSLASLSNLDKCLMAGGKAVVASPFMALATAGTVILSPSLGLVMLPRWDWMVGINSGALVNSTIFPLPRPRPLFKVGVGRSVVLIALGIEARTSSRWRLVDQVEEDDLDRRRDLLSSLAFLAGLLVSGGDFGITNSKPTLGSELMRGEGCSHQTSLGSRYR